MKTKKQISNIIEFSSIEIGSNKWAFNDEQLAEMTALLAELVKQAYGEGFHEGANEIIQRIL